MNGYKKETFEKKTVFLSIGINVFTHKTYKIKLRSTGEFFKGKPMFKLSKRGSIREFVFGDLEREDQLLFELNTNNIAEITEKLKVEDNIENDKINLSGDIDFIRGFILDKNLNPFFNAYKAINHISYKREETPIFPEKNN